MLLLSLSLLSNWKIREEEEEDGKKTKIVVPFMNHDYRCITAWATTAKRNQEFYKIVRTRGVLLRNNAHTARTDLVTDTDMCLYVLKMLSKSLAHS